MRREPIVFYLLATFIAFNSLVRAHEGVTFPIFKNKVIDTVPVSTLSIIADPDLKIGSLTFIFKEVGSSQNVDGIENLKIETTSTFVEAPSEVLEVLKISATWLEGTNNFIASIPFHTAGRWNIHFRIFQSGKIIDEFDLPLDILRDGPSPKEFALYFLPFLLMAFVGLKVFFYKRNKKPV